MHGMQIFVLAKLERPLMNDYHEFKCAHDAQIENNQLYWSPNFVNIIGGSMTQTFVPILNGIVITFNSYSTSGNGVLMCNH